MTNKAVIYARFSPRRNADLCESCDMQIEACRHWCLAKDIEVAGVYRDDGISGAKSANRPGLQSALDHACKDRSILLCHSLSRLARNIKECLTIVDRLDKAKADFACIKESFDTTTPSGVLIFHIFAALQEFERRQTATRTSDAMLRYIANGRKMSSQANFGFRFDGDSMVEDAAEQAAIARMLDLRLEGMSLRAIGKNLLSEGHTPRGNTFSARLIMNVLKKQQLPAI